jgi:hypothetical protein
VVITDIDPLSGQTEWSSEDKVRSLLYVGMTRALSRVVVLAHVDWRDKLEWAPMDAMGLDPKGLTETWLAAEE